MKIPHQPSLLTNHLADMRRFMPAEHRAVIERVEVLPSLREPWRTVYNEAGGHGHVPGDAPGLAQAYIDRWVDDPRGTGGTPYMQWLKQLIDETRAHKHA